MSHLAPEQLRRMAQDLRLSVHEVMTTEPANISWDMALAGLVRAKILEGRASIRERELRSLEGAVCISCFRLAAKCGCEVGAENPAMRPEIVTIDEAVEAGLSRCLFAMVRP